MDIDAYQTLVIVLSVMLGLFLLISIVLGLLLIKILKRVRMITDKAEHVVENVESVGLFFRKAAGPLALGKFVTNIAETVINRKSTRDGNNKRRR